MKKLIYILLAVIISANAVENVEINGFVRNYSGLLTGGNNEFSVIQNTFSLDFRKRADRIGFLVSPYLKHYMNDSLELNLKEAYMDMYFDNFDLRIGKQQIIYGKADGIFITDVVSPKDLSEFILPEFDEIRIGITSAKLSYYKGNGIFELTWVPVFTSNTLPDASSIWRPASPDFSVAPVFDYSGTDVEKEIENGEVFLRYSAMGSKIDYEIVAGHFFSDDPVMNVYKEINPGTGQITAITIEPEHPRLSMGGGSFSLPVAGFVWRSEGAYYSGKMFQTKDPEEKNSLTEKDFLHYMTGLDYSLFDTTLSTQFVQEAILDYDSFIEKDEFTSTLTFLAKKDFLREKLWLELFGYYGINEEDMLLRPKISYSFADGFDIITGANLFFGETGSFGQFDDNDMVYAKIKYSF
ncbi:MAG: hypothetical protein JXN63_00510 [Candidatus Delongbacteria bacterium]|nr:hypothetical protein [Candidatus Delongbacteria bacterium]